MIGFYSTKKLNRTSCSFHSWCYIGPLPNQHDYTRWHHLTIRLGYCGCLDNFSFSVVSQSQLLQLLGKHRSNFQKAQKERARKRTSVRAYITDFLHRNCNSTGYRAESENMTGDQSLVQCCWEYLDPKSRFIQYLYKFQL